MLVDYSRVLLHLEMYNTQNSRRRRGDAGVTNNNGLIDGRLQKVEMSEYHTTEFRM